MLSNLDAIPEYEASTNKELQKENPINVELTLDELREFDGTDSHKPVYVAINGVIYDVTCKRHLYALGKGYHILAGRECARALAKGCLTEDMCSNELNDLNDEEFDTLKDWETYYNRSYPNVGRVVYAHIK
ncbi:putative progesterone binding protein [Rozella allomycis CSF55]|uniref:Cytochrome b5-like heme/steroid binding domain-containing protein n=1 Tax=Rozella allomycis (strain CSF55) TaxID=988480 RepID=A0A075B205_ROZAC|nr:Cytochrome b5-like heme/steroid binding domain-containing protein [Rozella allomycis CSF55]RKP17466.1 putative progesterone binding protein [Rozella allomycis CSF55]|eukprot:EPZ34843.1 Cytochrome b5-like heme/steroid binding domain-containing protein [Rozella allomycis CSF55]